jgi:chaperonin GroEL
MEMVKNSLNDLAGDGTTTATVLAQAIVRRIEKRCCSKSMDLKRGIDKVQAIVTDLAKQSKVVGTDSDKIKQISI